MAARPLSFAQRQVAWSRLVEAPDERIAAIVGQQQLPTSQRYDTVSTSPVLESRQGDLTANSRRRALANRGAQLVTSSQPTVANLPTPRALAVQRTNQQRDDHQRAQDIKAQRSQTSLRIANTQKPTLSNWRKADDFKVVSEIPPELRARPCKHGRDTTLWNHEDVPDAYSCESQVILHTPRLPTPGKLSASATGAETKSKLSISHWSIDSGALSPDRQDTLWQKKFRPEFSPQQQQQYDQCRQDNTQFYRQKKQGGHDQVKISMDNHDTFTTSTGEAYNSAIRAAAASPELPHASSHYAEFKRRGEEAGVQLGDDKRFV